MSIMTQPDAELSGRKCSVILPVERDYRVAAKCVCVCVCVCVRVGLCRLLLTSQNAHMGVAVMFLEASFLQTVLCAFLEQFMIR